MVSLPPEESFKASSIRIPIAARFEGRQANLRWLGRASWISKLQVGVQIPTFELTFSRLFLVFLGHKVGIFFLGLAT